MITKHSYYIYTDSWQCGEFEADDIRDALDQVDVPSHVTDVDSFCAWLEKCGEYGEIHEDGIIIAKVAS